MKKEFDLELFNKLQPYKKVEYTTKLISRPHKLVLYKCRYDGAEFLHYGHKFGYTDFSRQIDRFILEAGLDLIFINGDNDLVRVAKSKIPNIEGRELILYDNDGNVTFDEWVYHDKKSHKWYDINGYQILNLYVEEENYDEI